MFFWQASLLVSNPKWNVKTETSIETGSYGSLDLEGSLESRRDRNVPRRPRLAGGVKGHNVKQNHFTGKPRPVAGELPSGIRMDHHFDCPSNSFGKGLEGFGNLVEGKRMRHQAFQIHLA